MSDPLTDAYGKLGRAEHHLRIADRLLSKWESVGHRPKPYSLRAEIEATPREPRPHPVYRLIYHEPIPSAAASVIGDCVHNLRGALDYLAWGLPRTPSPDPERIQFPIWTDRWHPNSPKVGGLVPGAMDAIKNLQPFNGPNRRVDRPHDLANLLHLSNWDKHRQLTVQGANSGIWSWYGPTPVVMHAGPFPHEAPVAEFAVNAEVSMNPDYAALVAFSQPPEVGGLAVENTLHWIAEYIRESVIPALQPFL